MSWRKLSYALLFATVFVGLVGLGFWQYSRFQQKTHWLNQLWKAEHQRALTQVDLKSDNWQPFRRLQLTGRWLDQHTFLIAGAFRHQRAGYWVITPWQWGSGEPWVLVNRGWVGSVDGRHHPVLQSPKALPKVVGQIYQPIGHRYVLGPWRLPIETKTPVIQDWDFKKLAKLLNHPVKPFVLRLSSKVAGEYERAWSWTALPPSRHRGYMLQWWAFALVWLIGSVVWFRKIGNKI